MSDFVKTMKDWRRMCSARIKLYGYDFCKGCSLENFRCPAIYNTEADTDYSIVERKVSAWAAEHPEPRYPTWGEWLIKQGVLKAGTTTMHGITWQPVGDNLFEPIPANIAEKLGLKSII